MPQTFHDSLVAMIKAHEGVLNFMYADTNRIVTIGAGHALFTESEAIALRFFHRDGTTPASPAEIIAEWERVKSIPITPGKEALASLFMPNDDIDILLQSDLQRFAIRVSEEIANFAALPEEARLACFDIAYNTGSLYGWPKLRAAMAVRNWEMAAGQCFRPELEPRENPGTADDPHGTRNRDTRALFLACANTTERTL